MHTAMRAAPGGRVQRSIGGAINRIGAALMIKADHILRPDRGACAHVDPAIDRRPGLPEYRYRRASGGARNGCRQRALREMLRVPNLAKERRNNLSPRFHEAGIGYGEIGFYELMQARQLVI